MKISSLEQYLSRPTFTTGFRSSRAVLVSVALLVIASAPVAGAHAQVLEYEGEVFTNKGQSTVAGFEKKLMKAKDKLLAVKDLKVYVGHHGNQDGTFDCDFNITERDDVLKMKTMFPEANLVWMTPNVGLTDSEIVKAVEDGKAFFTWCDSDTRVNKVMDPNMPNQIID